MPADFHARFSAIARRYRYITLNQTFRPAILNHQVTHEYAPLDICAMQQAVKDIEGVHDFTISSRSRLPVKPACSSCAFCPSYPTRRAIGARYPADGFLHHMVRNLMGTLFEIGRGVKNPPNG